MQQLRAIAPNQLWSWDITYLPSTLRGIWLYHYLVIVVWSRKLVDCDGAEREDLAIAADPVSRACLKERISTERKQQLILHADNGNAIRASTLGSRVEGLGELKSFEASGIEREPLLGIPVPQGEKSTVLPETPDFRKRTSTPEHALASETPTAKSKGVCQTGHGDVRP